MQSLCDDDQRASDASGGPFQRRCRTPCWSDGLSGDAPIEFNPFFPSRDFPPSRFELHISLTTFPPIVIPSSTPRLANSRAAAPSKRYGFLPLHSNESTEAVAEHIPRDGTLAAHARSVRHRSRPCRERAHEAPQEWIACGFQYGEHGGMAREAHAWNGQSLGSERYMANHTLRDASSPAFSHEPVLVRPSASAPVTSCLAGAGAGRATRVWLPCAKVRLYLPCCNLHFPPKATLRCLAVVQATIRSAYPISLRCPRPTPCARSRPTFFTWSSSGSAAAAASRRRAASSSRAPTTTLSAVFCNTIGSVLHGFSFTPQQPERKFRDEIGYRGLVFPLPPSSEEGLAMSYSSSQPSLFSAVSELKSAEHSNSPRRAKRASVEATKTGMRRRQGARGRIGLDDPGREEGLGREVSA